MYKPEVTIGLLRTENYMGYGLDGMERRIMRCCEGNPECSLDKECNILYGEFLDGKDIPPTKRGYRQSRSSPVVEDLRIYAGTYKFYGSRDIAHEVILRC